jgi:hypothetical protein
MRTICILAAAIAIAASPALAQSGRKAQAQRLPEVPSSDPYGPQKRYTDPDPNIRFEMMRQQQWRKGG